MNAASESGWVSPRALIDGFQAHLQLAYAQRAPMLLRQFFELPLYVATPTRTVVISAESECIRLADSLFAAMDEGQYASINAESVRVRQINPSAALVDLTLALLNEAGEPQNALSATCTLTKTPDAGWRAFSLLFGSGPARR